MTFTQKMTVAANEYHFVSKWRFKATCDEVFDILKDPLALPRWWPEVYLKVKELQAGGDDGIGRTIRLHTKGWLPYTLRWQFVVTQVSKPYGFSLIATGDLVGAGEWTFIQDEDEVLVTYDWKVRANKPLIRRLSFLMKPIFAMNHDWAMAKGEKALLREILRIREMKHHADSIWAGA